MDEGGEEQGVEEGKSFCLDINMILKQFSVSLFHLPSAFKIT